MLRGTRPPPIRSATGVGIARAPLLPLKLASADDPPDLTWFDELPGGNAPAWTPEHLVDTIDELEHWKHKQIQTTPTMLRVNRVLAWLASELARKRKAKPAPLKRGAVRPEQPETLRAHKTIVYTSATALREEIGRIRTYLPYASAGERRILAIELPGLLAQFQDSRAAAEGDRRTNEVAQALSQSTSGARAELLDMAQRVDTIRPVPGKPGVQALYGAHSVILLSDHEAAALRANLRLALDQAAARVRSVNQDTFADGSEWIDHNEAHRRVGSVVAWYGRDPIATEEAALDYVVKSNILLNLYHADRGKDLPLAKTALLVVDAAELARMGVEESASAQEHALATAGKWLTALKVSETILTTMVAMEGAEVVGPRAAGFFRGVGLPGAAASVAGGATTIAVVATADGLLHAVPATLGARLFGSPDDDLGAVFTDEFWAGAKEGAFAATSVQATLGFDKLLGVAASDVSRLGKFRSITAGGLGNATSGLAQSLIERRGLADTALTGGLDFVVGGAGRGFGFLTRGAPPRVREFANTLFGATTSALISAKQGGNAIEIAGAAAQGGALMGKERPADEQATATARGLRAGEWVRSRAIDVIAATMLGAELPGFRGPGSGGERIVLTDTAPRPALLSGGPALRAPTPNLVATREQPVAIAPASGSWTAVPATDPQGATGAPLPVAEAPPAAEAAPAAVVSRPTEKAPQAGTIRPGGTAPGREAAAAGSFRAELAAARPDVAARFAELDAAFARSGEEGAAPSAAFDAAMSVLERKGMGPEGRQAVERLFEPGQGQAQVSAGRARRAAGAMERVAAVVTEREDLLSPEGQDRYQRAVRGLAKEVLSAYGNRRTLDGAPLSSRDSPELARAMQEMQRTLDSSPEASLRDPVARLLELMRLRDAAARAGEILRSYGPQFTATPRAGEPTPVADRLVAGVPERLITVEASGVVSEPLARDLPGLGLEEYMLPPRELADLPTRARGLGQRLAQLLAKWHRAHLIGPGFGTELFTGMMLAPESVNLRAQNEGVEHFIRTAAAVEGVTVEVKATAHGRRLEVPLRRGRPEQIDVLSRVEYSITVTHEQGATRTYEVTIEIGDPPGGEIRVDSTIPPTAPGGDVLATFPRITPVPTPPTARTGTAGRTQP